MLAVLKPSELFAAQGKFSQLPSPSSGDSGSLMLALKNRKSTRSLSSKALPQQIMSDLLWAAFGVNRPDIGFRTALSPISSQEIEIYVATANGLYFYAAADTGFISQNVYLFCAAFGLGTVVRDWINRPALAAKINLHEDQGIILAQTVGYPK